MLRHSGRVPEKSPDRQRRPTSTPPCDDCSFSCRRTRLNTLPSSCRYRRRCKAHRACCSWCRSSGCDGRSDCRRVAEVGVPPVVWRKERQRKRHTAPLGGREERQCHEKEKENDGDGTTRHPAILAVRRAVGCEVTHIEEKSVPHPFG